MTDNNLNQGNPETTSDENVQNEVFGSNDSNIFERMENDVNGAIQDKNSEVTQPNSGTEQATHDQRVGSNSETNDVDYEKRYKDSSREAIKWRDRYKEVEAFVPVLDAMKNDSGLVDHVRGYLQNGGAPAQNIQEKLGIKDDFVFDAHESVTNPDSDSAKVMNAHVDQMVSERVGQMLHQEKQNAQQMQAKAQRKEDELAFKQKHNMTDQQFEEFVVKAKQHVLTLDDVNYLLNRDQVASNTANSAKADMINQMKNVRNIPTSVSGANSQSKGESVTDTVFNTLKGHDESIDNLFG